jgi:ribosome-binding factor A
MQGKRLERVNQLMREEISRLVQRELKDPRLGWVTITEVAVTPDLRQAKVFVSVLGSEDKWVASFKALESARGFIWGALRRNLDLRVTPELDFRPDRSMEHAARMQALLAGLTKPAKRAPVEDED